MDDWHVCCYRLACNLLVVFFGITWDYYLKPFIFGAVDILFVRILLGGDKIGVF